MNRCIALLSLILSTALLSVSNAQARWGGGFYQCKNTPLIEYPGTIAEAAAEDPFGNLGILYEAVLEADPNVAEVLSDPNVNLTVFAPENAAFLAIPEETREAILGDQGLLTNILLYHVLDSRFDPRKVLYIRKKDTALGQDVFVSRGYSNPKVNQSEIQCQGVSTVNGIVWLINSVLLPQYLQ